MNKITADLFRKYMAGAKTLLPVEKMKISDIKNILYSYNSLAREHGTNEISLTDIRSFKKVEAYDAAQTLLGVMQEGRKKAVEESIENTKKALLNPDNTKAKVEGLTESDITEEFNDKANAIFKALAEKLDERDDKGNLIYQLNLGDIMLDSYGARAYIFQHSTSEFSTMNPDEIAEQVISLYGNKTSAESISISQEAPRPTSIIDQAESFMRGRYNA